MKIWTTRKTQLAIALLLAAAAGQAAADAVLSLHASNNPAVLGSTVELDVAIADVVDLYAYQFSLSFDPTLLRATGANIGSFFPGSFSDAGSVDNTLGQISFTFASLLGVRPGVSGGGQLAHFSFNVIGVGSSALNFSDVLLLNSNLNELPATLQPMSLQTLAVPEPEAYMMLGVGLVGLAALRRRQLKQTAA